MTQHVDDSQLAKLKALAATLGLDVRRKPRGRIKPHMRETAATPNAKAKTLATWAKRTKWIGEGRFVKWYKGIAATQCSGHEWRFHDLPLPWARYRDSIMVRLWNDSTIEPRFDDLACERYLVAIAPRKRLLTYQPSK